MSRRPPQKQQQQAMCAGAQNGFLPQSASTYGTSGGGVYTSYTNNRDPNIIDYATPAYPATTQRFQSNNVNNNNQFMPYNQTCTEMMTMAAMQPSYYSAPVTETAQLPTISAVPSTCSSSSPAMVTANGYTSNREVCFFCFMHMWCIPKQDTL